MSSVVLLFGGTSSERLVSVASAQNVSRVLTEAECWFIDERGAVFVVAAPVLQSHQRAFELPFQPPGTPRWPSLDSALDSARGDETFFLCLHGGDGENGVTQSALERRGLAFTGSDAAASALAFDKAKTKSIAAARGARIADAVTVPPASVLSLQSTLRELLGRHHRWVLKPQADGSSHGLVHLSPDTDLAQAAQTLHGVDRPYLAERFVEGRELTVGVVDSPHGPRALPVSEVRLIPGGAFDYAGKYLGRGTEEVTPARLTDAERAAAQALAVLTHLAVGCFGYSRTDMILSAEGPVLLEINTLPGLTKASFIPQQLAAEGASLETFLREQLALARRRSGRAA